MYYLDGNLDLSLMSNVLYTFVLDVLVTVHYHLDVHRKIILIQVLCS